MSIERSPQASIPKQHLNNGILMNENLNEAPYFIDSCNTLPKLFHKRCKELGSRTAHREKKFGIWLSYSWHDFYQKSKYIGLGLVSLGLKRGEVVSILSENKKEWIYTDIATICVGGMSTGIYTTDSAKQLDYLVSDSQSRFLFIENDKQLDKYLKVKNQLDCISRVIVFDRTGLHDFSDNKVIFLDELYELGKQLDSEKPHLFQEKIAESKPEEIAIMVYTSGTTGMPKGGMISHSNIMFSVSTTMDCAPTNKTDEQICFLPLCHILERMFSCFIPIAFMSTVNFAESPETVFDNLQEVSPHTFVAVPRLWEKIYSRVTILLSDATPLQRWAFSKALKSGEKRARCLANKQSPSLFANLNYKFWDFTVLSNVRRMLGMNNIRRGLTAAAPISPEILKWFRALGVKVFEGYGMTETTAVISLNTHGRDKIGSVGKAIKGGNIRIAANGEIQYQSGNVFQGYWNMPDKNVETITKDGWLKTGDIGEIDQDGFLTITGRLKDIITTGGKNIMPAEIENQLKLSPYIVDAVIIGDKRKYLSCLVMIDQENIEKFAQNKRIPFNNFQSLCAVKEVQKLIENIISEVNQDLAKAEQIKVFRLIDTLLTADDDELTATFKLKRNFVESKHKSLIDDMY